MDKKGRTIYNLQAYNKYNDRDFALILTEGMGFDQIVKDQELGHHVKKGKNLILTEAHTYVCQETHKNGKAHDPKYYIEMTCCLVNHLSINYYNSLS